ncbi:Glucan endo-1 [Psidium guajava]|nr:Glucan endo-1 [Psidium guajava]
MPGDSKGIKGKVPSPSRRDSEARSSVFHAVQRWMRNQVRKHDLMAILLLEYEYGGPRVLKSPPYSWYQSRCSSVLAHTDSAMIS